MSVWLLLLLFVFVGYSCGSGGGMEDYRKSRTTGWDFNDVDNGGFELHRYGGQETGPGLVLIEGGAFTMGLIEQDVLFEFHSIPKTVTVPSFYMDETEVTNAAYREYEYWMKRVMFEDFPEVFYRCVPDTLVWRDVVALNDPYAENYYSHPAYLEYPVVGVSWIQASEYCKWRTDRVNEQILVDQGYIAENPSQAGEDNFNTKAYLVGQYEPSEIKHTKRDYSPNGDGTRNVRWSDGLLLPNYRLPTEAEWEYAALALMGNNPVADEIVTDRKIYPWNGRALRNPVHGGWWGEMLANFKRGDGDYAGVAGKLNDNAFVTAPAFAYPPNAFGLYNMAGNVNEWTLDVYRPLSPHDKADFNPYRGNVFTKIEMGPDGYEMDSIGRLAEFPVTEDENANRRNYKKSEYRDFLDGDETSEVIYYVSTYSVESLISNQARIYKGGGWKDLAFYLSPGTRRYLDENQSTNDIGFRCAMNRVGSPQGNAYKGGNWFKN
ncbi:MAG: SUMF1/EgtB/PvdO family nonheme iron enzyme [Bacteroidetes bacterium]|nr:SUMF1/EgtB/PvdO family nonheme iron enzyme [Bacteroidota bacterium]